MLKSSKKMFVSNRLLGKDRDDLALKATVVFGSFLVEHMIASHACSGDHGLRRDCNSMRSRGCIGSDVFGGAKDDNLLRCSFLV